MPDRGSGGGGEGRGAGRDLTERRRTVDADVRNSARRTNQNQSGNGPGVPGFRVEAVDTRQRRAAHCDWYRVLPRVTRIEMRRIVIVIMMGGDLRMRVRRRSVIVLGMIVTAVRVGVQGRHPADNSDKGEGDRNGQQALHRPSLWKLGLNVNRD